MGFRQTVCMAVALLGFFTCLATAQNTASNTTASSTFYLSHTETQFSINIANDSNDVFIYFRSPAYSWVGVGFGEKMAGSLMIIMYPNSNGDNVTLSPRIGSQASEPSFAPSVGLSILPGTSISDSMLVLRARCSNCRAYMDTETEAQAMIYAFGHGQNLMDDSPAANLERHIRYGRFSMDMRTATGAGGVPPETKAENGVSMLGDMVRDHDRANLAHAIVGCVALFVLWPVNMVAVAFFKNVKVHVGVSVLVFAFLGVSFGLGGVVSGEFNRIMAFVTILPLLLTAILPPLARFTTAASKLRALHTPLVSLSFILLVLTGGLGLHLSSQARPIILVYTAISLAVFIFLLIMQSCIRKRGSAYARATGRHHKQALSREYGESDRMVMLSKMEDSYSASSASLTRPPPPYTYYQGGDSGGSAEFGADGQLPPTLQQTPPRSRQFGGGTMPGPHYLLNMHPGVPVQVSRM
ncbi:iron reductase domain protein [Stemphylium lycopersici]|nr:iron reductase domain protein [Stemphylium lycopersici]